MAKSRAKELRDWRKKNSEKVKQQSKKDNDNYYKKTKDKRSLDFKINYQKRAIRNCVPFQYYEYIDDKWQDITVDHEYFDNTFCRPRTLWRTILGRKFTLQEIQTNIDYVIRLQTKNIIPKFLFNHAETCFLYDELQSLHWTQIESTIGIPKEDWSTKFKEDRKEQDELFVKLLNENYEKHIQKTKLRIIISK